MRPDPDTCRDPELLAAEVRRLRDVIDSGSTMQDAAEPSGASAGSQPVAWMVALGGDGFIIDGIFLRKTQADEACAWRNEHTTYGARIVPLYCHAQPTLTDEERKAIAWAIDKTAQGYDDAEGGPMKREAMRDLLRRAK